MRRCVTPPLIGGANAPSSVADEALSNAYFHRVCGGRTNARAGVVAPSMNGPFGAGNRSQCWAPATATELRFLALRSVTRGTMPSEVQGS